MKYEILSFFVEHNGKCLWTHVPQLQQTSSWHQVIANVKCVSCGPNVTACLTHLANITQTTGWDKEVKLTVSQHHQGEMWPTETADIGHIWVELSFLFGKYNTAMTTRNIFTTITSQGNALFQKPLMPLLHLLGSTRLHSTGFCLFSIINEYHLNVGMDIIAIPTKVRDIICMQHKQNTTMEDVEVHLLRHPPSTYLTGQSVTYSLLTSHLWLRSLGTLDKFVLK